MISKTTAPKSKEEAKSPKFQGQTTSADLRKDSDADRNKIEFNDPTLSQEEAVAENLKDAG